MKPTIFALMILSPLGAMSQQNFDTVKIRPVKLTESLYMLKGSGGNIGVLIGKDGTLMVDDQFAPLSNKINGAIKTLDPGEIRFLVNTHIHGDHSGGNENFRHMGVTVVAHNNVRSRMQKESVNRQGQTQQPRAADAWPMVTFEDRLNFHLNDEDIELIHLNPGHTDGDVIIHFVKANVYHTGDSFVRYGYPYIDGSNGGSFTGFIGNLDKILSLLDDNSRVMPGHGEVATKADVNKLREQLADIRDQVSAALKKGKKPEELPALGITDKYDAELGKGFLKGKDFVIIAADALKADVTVPAKKK